MEPKPSIAGNQGKGKEAVVNVLRLIPLTCLMRVIPVDDDNQLFQLSALPRPLPHLRIL